MQIVKTIISENGELKLLIYKRDDGHFQAGMDWIIHDDENECSYWGGSFPFAPIYETAEIAEREGATDPQYMVRVSN